MACPDILPTILDAASFLQERGIAYMHLVEEDWDDAPQFSEVFRRELGERFSRKIIVVGKYDVERANTVLSKGYADFVAFGRDFVANPDLPRRLARGLPLADFDGNTLFGGISYGYIDYPVWEPADLSVNVIPTSRQLAHL